jgi:hypothetical protein
MFRKILVPLDGSANAEQAIPAAIAIARSARAAIDLLRVHQPLQIQVVTAFQELEQTNWHAENEALDLVAGDAPHRGRAGQSPIRARGPLHASLGFSCRWTARRPPRRCWIPRKNQDAAASLGIL